jgi:hypothetical protein
MDRIRRLAGRRLEGATLFGKNMYSHGGPSRPLVVVVVMMIMMTIT